MFRFKYFRKPFPPSHETDINKQGRDRKRQSIQQARLHISPELSIRAPLAICPWVRYALHLRVEYVKQQHVFGVRSASMKNTRGANMLEGGSDAIVLFRSSERRNKKKKTSTILQRTELG